MLVDETLFGTVDKVRIAIERLKMFEPPEGYYVAFSGGKDSCVLKDLVKRSGVKAEFHFNRSMEPPEVIYFIREHHADVVWHLPKHTMWQLIEKNGMPPTQTIRYCCREMKENDKSAKGRLVVTGVRHAESLKRRSRQMVEQCRVNNGKRFLHPIIDWSDGEVWQYIRDNKLPYCQLYDEGRERVGCVMCPMSNKDQMLIDAERWPKIADAYKAACEKAYKRNIEKGNEQIWRSGEDMFRWWIFRRTKEHPDQTVFFFE